MSDFELNDDDVVSMSLQVQNPMGTPTFKVSQLREKILDALLQRGINKWINGVDAQYLKTTGGGWQKGKFRVRLEFIPDEPESPLDEMREKFKQSQQSPPSDESQLGNE